MSTGVHSVQCHLRLHSPLRGSRCWGGANAWPTWTPPGKIVDKTPEKSNEENLGREIWTTFDGKPQAFPPVRLNAVKKVKGDGPSVTERYMQVNLILILFYSFWILLDRCNLQMLRPEEWRRLVSLYTRDATMFGYNNDIEQLGKSLREKWGTSTQ